MKRQIISAGLALLLSLTPATATFSDISDAKLAQTAAVLDALGLMQGVGENRFAPEDALTRAQFCKLAVTTMGVTDVSGYGRYSIFPDVPGDHWAAAYINAAVRDSELKKSAIIRGYADGTFQPDKPVTFGEACTMLLRMLGYEDSDIGPFWPLDFVAFAQNLGLADNVSITSPDMMITRADAATMLMNALNTDQKGDDSSPLMSRVTSSTVENCILLATSDTDSELAENEALFYENGAVADLPRRTAGKLDKSLIGTNGTLLLGKKDDKSVLALLPNSNRVDTVKVTEAKADSFRADGRKLTPGRESKLYIAREEKLDSYETLWSSLKDGDKLSMYYDEYGSLELMAVLPEDKNNGPSTFVYGIATAVKIPDDYTVIKNGVTVDRSKLKKYDVVTFDHANNCVRVSDVKLSGVYEEGTPTFRYPSEVRLYEDTYYIADRSATLFRDINLGDKITLLFDAEGDVAAVYPQNIVSASTEGFVTALDADKKATIVLTNGLTIHAVVREESAALKLIGEMTTLSQSNGQNRLSRIEPRGKESGAWDLSLNTLGNRNVSPDVRVFEKVDDDASLNLIELSDIRQSTIPSKQIQNTFVDSAGSVITIVLNDISGTSWLYGVSYQSNTHSDDESSHTAGLRYWNGEKMVIAKYPISDPSRMGSGVPVAIPKGYSESAENSTFTFQRLLEIDSVPLSAFDGTSGVQTRNGYFSVIDDVGVYIKSRKEMCSLADAKNNYRSFTLYANKSLEEGGQICLILVDTD